jgi:O-methyltransferase involved in polyketide biosynthesis
MTTKLELSGVAETLLLPLYIRASESRRPDAIVKDPAVEHLIDQLEYDFSGYKFDKEDQVAIILRNRQFDRNTQDFLARRADAVVVHLGCGLDSRFGRVDDGRVEWYDLDLPEVIELRRQLLDCQNSRYHLLSCSMLAEVWQEALTELLPRPFLFLAEGVFMYFPESQIRQLILSLRKRFSGSELVFDGFSRLVVWANNRMLGRTKIRAKYEFALTNGKDLESWGEGIRFLDEWRYFDCNEPRLDHIRWVRHLPPLAKSAGIFHYRLG